jgi:hypothetical protein
LGRATEVLLRHIEAMQRAASTEHAGESYNSPLTLIKRMKHSSTKVWLLAYGANPAAPAYLLKCRPLRAVVECCHSDQESCRSERLCKPTQKW